MDQDGHASITTSTPTAPARLRDDVSLAMLSGVTIIGDVLRPDGSGRPGGTDAPTTWLFDAVKRQVNRASGLPVDLLTARSCPDLGAALATHRLPHTADAVWAEGFAHLPDTILRAPWLERSVLARLRGRFCIGWELPPGLVALLDANAIAWLDLRVHPIRFLDDLLFAARAADARTQAALAAIAVPEDEVLATAGLREAMCRLIATGTLPPRTLIVVGQRPTDSSQIIGGRFFDAGDHLAAINAVCARYAAVVLKPHPLERDHGLLLAAAGAPARVLGAVSDNIYRLLALPEVAAVLTVNSSVAYEAPYFGKTVHALAALPVQVGWRGDPAPPVAHMSVRGEDVLSVDFWRCVLAPHASVTPCDGVRLAPKPNRLRIALDSFWGFQELDTDRIPRPDPVRAAAPPQPRS
jgi:hypothetical protein